MAARASPLAITPSAEQRSPAESEHNARLVELGAANTGSSEIAVLVEVSS
jgi:hypothetical protein